MTKKQRLEIANAILKDAGVKHWHKIPKEMALRSYSNFITGGIVAPEPTDNLTLTILAHEAGHVATTQAQKALGRGKLNAELEATRWGFSKIREHGGKVTRAMQDSARRALESQADHPSVYHAHFDGSADIIRAFVNRQLDL